MLFAESQVLPVPIDLIGQDSLWITAGSLMITLCCADEYIAFVV